MSVASLSWMMWLNFRPLAALLMRRKPLLLRAMLSQVPRQKTVHQVQQLRSLGACWLGAQDRKTLDRALQTQMLHLSLSFLTSSSSNAKTGRSTTKHRR